MDATVNWPELVKHPGHRDHPTPGHRAAILERLDPQEAIKQGQLKLLDAEETLGRFMTSGMPGWRSFHEIAGGAIAELRLQYPAVRAYGEMVDVLWQKGQREAAIRLEEYWNELGRLQTFSLFCAYSMDNLDGNAYGGPLECICKVHTHLIPVRDHARFDRAVNQAAKKYSTGRSRRSCCRFRRPRIR